MKTLKSLYLGENPVNFPSLWKRAFIASLIVLIIGIGSFVVRGLNLGLDFEGGTSYEVRSSSMTVSDTREVLSSLGAADSRVQKVGDDLLRVRSDIDDPQKANELRELLENQIGVVETFEQVGPTWGSDVTSKAIKALLVFFVVVAVYLTIRLEWKMALGALVAVVHDIIISVGVYSFFQFEITPATVVAFLTIMGYSLYDTIVVYDKVREITGRLGATEKYSYTEMMNLALNRVAMRSINTSISSALPVLSLLVIGALIMGSAAKGIVNDIEQVRSSARARSEAAMARKKGEAKLLLTRNVQVSYDKVQVLFGIDIDVAEGEIVALLGTNGAGKSTLLKAISGVTEADRGTIVLDGRDITHAPPNEIAALGISQLPGGHAIFPNLSVKENIAASRWLTASPERNVKEITQNPLEIFPEIAERLDEPAANLSGGQQQMLGLAMALHSKPKVLLIDELSLGLAPAVVERILPVIKQIADQGTAIIVVEQSVNLALTIADRAYFMEKGQIRFNGSTKDLLKRPDLLRSVFLSNTSIPAVETNAKPSTKESKSILEIENMTRSFGGILAVSSVTFDVRSNEIIGIMGPNGAGKTTLFDLLSGFIPSQGGSIKLLGQDITNKSPAERSKLGLGRSFQDARLFPSLTVAEAIAVGLERFISAKNPISGALHLPHVSRSEKEIRKQVNDLIELMGLEAYENKFISELSTGTRRMVDLACVIAHKPAVVLLDEPSSGIAQKEAEQLSPVLKRIRNEMNAALVVIEHDIALLSELSDQFVALNQGTVIAQGEPGNVLSNPSVISSYLGSSKETIQRSGTL